MPKNRLRQIEEIFQSALALAPEERSKFVRDRTPDPEIRREIEKLLSDNKSAAAAEENNYEPNINEPTGLTGEEFLDLPTDKQTDSELSPRDDKAATDNKAGQAAAEAVVDRLIGQRVGVFELKKEIGRGGMGAVYLAERADGEFRQKVAVKLIKRGMDTDFIVRRFRHERQILANLNHPNIANLLDGGTSADGLPYFVMEFIEGELLYNYCDKNRLDIRQRLQIFKQVCSAVQAAHEHQIIHRDIKPGNILVTAMGVPKLLDFGIAKILDPDLIHESVHPTSTMMRLMTLDYASPEQICGGEITPASDVYALGVLLYELLTGHNPYNFINGRSPHEVSRVICEIQPELPSRSVASRETLLPLYTSNNISAEKSAEFRGGNTIDALQLELTDNLDRILMKALSKAPKDRFASVKEFVADITRHLSGQTALAEPRLLTNSFSHTEITERTNVSNKSIAVLPFKLLNIAAGDETGDKFLGIGLADALITRLSNVQRFVVRPTSSVLRYGEKHLDPFATARELDVEFILEGHIQKVGKRIRVSVQLLNVAEQTTVWAERFDENYTDVLHLEDVISVRAAEALIPQLTTDEREILAKRGTDNPKAFESYLRGRFHWNTFTEEGFAKAIVAFHEAIAHDPNYAVAYAGIADYYNWLAVFGILPAQECFQSAIEAATKAISLDRDLSEAHAALGFAVVGGHYDWAQGETACRRALKLNPNNSTAHVWYSIQLFMEGRFEEGIKHAKRAIEIDPLAPFNHHNLGWGLYFARRFEESIEQYRQLITITNSKYPLAFFGLCWGLRLTKNFDEAIEAIEKALELDPESAFMLTCYGQTLAAAGRRKESEEVLAKLEKLAEQRFVSSYHIAIIYTFWGEKEKALTELEKSFEDRGEAWLVWMGVEPVFDSLREDVRFMNLLERTRNPLFHGENTVVMERRAETSANKIQTTDSDTQGFSKQTIVPPAAATRLPKWASVAAGMIILLLAGALFFAVRSNQNTNTPPNEQQNNLTENKIGNQPRATANTLSIAVLPFATVNAKTDDEQYLGVGTADLVTSKLSQIVEINLRSASSVRRYLKNDKSPVEAGRELAVDYVVSGTVERKENNVEVKLEMTEIASGRIVWSEIFDEPNGDLFALQDSISELIVKNLSLRLTNAEKQNLAKHFTENGEAQQLYVAGRFHFGKRTVEGLRQAISLFEKAIEMDPNFALAYTGIADCSALLNWYQEPQPPDAWAKAKEAATKAVALDNDLAEAHASLAFIKFHYDRDYRGSEEEFRRAINLKPNYATAHQWYAFLLSAQARHNEAISMMRRAEELEPRSAVIANAVANVLFLARQYDESITQANRSLEIDPSSVGAHVILRWNYEKLGMADRAMAIYEKETIFAGDTPTSRAKRAHVLAAIGKKDEALQILKGLISNKQIEQITPYEIGVIYALLDDKSKGLEWLKKARDVHAVGFSFVKVDPLLDNLRTDDRFQNLLQ